MARKTALTVLIAARELITPRKGWTKGWFARDAKGLTTLPHTSEAVCFCALGAIERCAGNATRLYDQAKTPLAAVVPHGDIALFNDAKRRTHKDILAAFDRAIAALRKTQRAA